MSKYQERLRQYIDSTPSFIQPEGKKSEVLGFLKQPLEDLCISRPKARLAWGIEIPFDRQYVTYVWFDALLNYASAIGLFQGPEREASFREFWPQAIHLIGKDILITHAVYWPCMLMALNLPLPKQIFAHGWWLNEESDKMSKSSGTVVKPLDMAQVVGVEAFRYFLCRDISLGNDAQFSKQIVINRVNSELSNNFGNLLSRSLSIAYKYFDAKVPPSSNSDPRTLELSKQALACADSLKEKIEAMAPNLAIGQVVELLNATNKYVDSLAPWKTAKENLALAGECIYTALEVLRIAAILLQPVMPNKMLQLLSQLGLEPAVHFQQAKTWGLLKSGGALNRSGVLFPRVEEKALQSI